MYSDDILRRYLNAVDIERAKVVNELLPLYDLGLESQNKTLERLQIHNGYHDTIQKYLLNRSVLSVEDIERILSLYNINTDHTVTVVSFTDHIIVAVPTVDVMFRVKEVLTNIVFVPQVTTEISRESVNISIVVIPQPIVSIEAIVEQLRISFTPEPDVIIPQTARVFNISLIPQPIVGLQAGEFTLMQIALVPAPIALFSTQANVGHRVYFGIIETANRPVNINFATLNNFVVPVASGIPVVPADLHILFPQRTGFAVLAIPAVALSRNRWFVDTLNQGLIGGNVDPVTGNLFPFPIVQTIEGVNYQVYISNYPTIFNATVIFRNVETIGLPVEPLPPVIN